MLAILLALALVVSSPPDRFSGAANACVALPSPIAYGFGTLSYPVAFAYAPKPAPYYKLTIAGGGEGSIALTVVWDPRAQLVRVAEHVTPPNPSYWEPTPPDAVATLKKLAKRLKPIPAGHWH